MYMCCICSCAICWLQYVIYIYVQLYIHKYRSLTLPPFSKGNNGWEMLWNVLNTKPKISQCVEYWFEKNETDPSKKSIYTTVLMLPLVAFKRSQPCMNGIAILNDRVRKKALIFSLMVVKPPGYNGDAVRISFPSAPLFQKLAEQAPPDENCISSPSTENRSRRKSRRKQTADATADAAHPPEPAPKPKAGTGTNCNLNAREQGKQHIELQKQHLDLPEQAPPHEIASAALQQKQQQKQQQTEQQTLLMLQSPKPNQKQEPAAIAI